MQQRATKSRSRSWEALRAMLLRRQAELAVSLSLNANGITSPASAPRVARVLNGKLERIQSALARIDAGTFGACLLCGRAIAEQQLQDVPWERFCAPCKENPGSRNSGAPSGSEILLHVVPKPA